MPVLHVSLRRGDEGPYERSPFWERGREARECPGAVPFPRADEVPFPRVVVDADGNEYSYVRWVNTDTGDICVYDVSPNGVWALDPRTRRVKTLRFKVSLPVEILPYATEECP